MITVVLMLWRDPKQRWRAVYNYNLRHVEVARRMIDRHLKADHRFVLATDDLSLPIDMEKVLIPQDLLACGYRWPKLILFSPKARELFGEHILYFDLDFVVLDDLDPLVTDHEFRIVGQTIPVKGMHYNSSIISLKTGSRPRVWDEFDLQLAEGVCREAGYQASDQFWIAKTLGPNEAKWGPADGVYQFRAVAEPDVPLPSNAKVVIFPGPYDPSIPALQEDYSWIKGNWR